MQKLSITEDEVKSRKEYLKNKKKKEKIINKKSKISYVIIGIVAILAIYVCIQFYIYYKQNNLTYLAGAGVDKQKIYDVYYVSKGYTYDDSYTLNTMKSSGFEPSVVYEKLNFTKIDTTKEYVYGICDNNLKRLNKETLEIQDVYNNVTKYTIYGNEIYVVVDKKITLINAETLEFKDLNISDISEILVDNDYLYVCLNNNNKKSLARFNKDGSNKINLTNSEDVSYIIQDQNNIYFVNKSDDNKIYSTKKDGTKIEKIADISSVTDSGNIEEIDGSKYMFVVYNKIYYINIKDNRSLWVYDLETKTNEKALHASIELLEEIDNTMFYKIKDEDGVYLYNVDTKFNSQINRRIVTEFVVD